MKNEVKGRDIFYGVVAVATLIVAIIGATLAYFSITTSSNEGAINATAAVVSIEYNDGQQVTAQADQLIPATLDVVKTVYESTVKNATTPSKNDGSALSPDELASEVGNICIDSNNRQVCSAYRFTIKSDVERSISATLNNEENGFTYLSYAVYKHTPEGGYWMDLADGVESLPLTACSNSNNEGPDANTNDDCYTMEDTKKVYSTQNPEAVNSLFGKTLQNGLVEKKSDSITGTQVYDLVLFIKENNQPQNMDQGQNYRGTIMVDVLAGGANGTITGCVGDDCTQ